MYDFRYSQAVYDANRMANIREMRSVTEQIDSKYRRDLSVAAIAARAEEIKKQIKSLDVSSQDYASRYARLNEILNNLQGTLKRCR